MTPYYSEAHFSRTNKGYKFHNKGHIQQYASVVTSSRGSRFLDTRYQRKCQCRHILTYHQGDNIFVTIFDIQLFYTTIIKLQGAARLGSTTKTDLPDPQKFRTRWHQNNFRIIRMRGTNKLTRAHKPSF